MMKLEARADTLSVGITDREGGAHPVGTVHIAAWERDLPNSTEAVTEVRIILTPTQARRLAMRLLRAVDPDPASWYVGRDEG